MRQKPLSSSRIVGANQVRKALLKGRQGTFLFALDADPALTEPLLELARSNGSPAEEISTMRELGRLCGLEVGAAVAFDALPLP
ncbi:MAG: ribosomal L7Ae/L30e/S12e/Gadd45 family protein [Oscillospiraceae bacterium]|nr:ribosomal L7Ae/L30e/S12e/Gadd45 family protein [Oscillospiraceae bacterium]